MQTSRVEDQGDGTPPGDVVEVADVATLPRDLGGLLLYVQNTTAVLGLEMGTKPGLGYKDGINDFITLRYVNRGKGSHFYHTFGTTLDPKDGVIADDLFGVSLSDDAKVLFFGGGSTGSLGSLFFSRWNLEGKTFNPPFGGWVGAHQIFNPRGSLSAFLTIPLQEMNHWTLDKVQLPLGQRGFRNDGVLDVRDATKPVKPYLTPDGEEPAPSSPQYPFWRVANDAVPRTAVWSSDSRLFFSRSGKGKLSATPTPITDAAQFPSVWVADPRTETSHQVRPRAYDPSPSPDGRYIAFFGWSQSEMPTTQKPAPLASLWLLDTHSGKVTPVDDMNAGQVLWTPDSQNLVEVRFNGDFEAHIRRIPLSIALSGPSAVAGLEHQGEVATVVAQDPLHVGERDWPQPIEVRSVTRNGRYLILNIREVTEQKGPRLLEKQTLKAVDLSNGGTWNIATTKPTTAPFGWQWFDLSNLK